MTKSRTEPLAAKVAFLADARHYRGRLRTVETIETHFAWVFLAGDRAYKLKKPLRQPPVDYSTLARRERACRAELELNRRLAPEVYRRVVPLGRNDAGELTRSARTKVVDWLVEMVRLPAGRMLDRTILAGALRPRDLERIVARLAAFFRCARRRPMSERSYLARLRYQILGNAHELRAPDLALDRSLVEQVIRSQLGLLDQRAELLASRGKRLIDGHGDLRPEHVFLGTRGRDACVIDCLEFDADLRRLDPAEEIAFLALECRRLGAVHVADDLIAQYARATGDPVSQTLIQFYMSRCAAVRAQIAAWHLRDAALAAQSHKWRARAHSYLADALRHIRRARALPGGTSGRGEYGESAARLAVVVAVVATIALALMVPVIGASAPLPANAPPTQWTEYQMDAPKSILELQPFRSVEHVELDGPGAGRGSATLVNINPTINVWFLLTVEAPGATPRRFHLENPRPLEQRPQLVMEGGQALVIHGLTGSAPCEVWSAARDSLEEAVDSHLPYASLCDGRLYVRNAVTGHQSSLERITDFLRDHIYGGEEIISLVKEQMYRDAFLEPGVGQQTADCAPSHPASPDLPLAAAVSAEAAVRCLTPGSLGLDVAGAAVGFSPGRWYPVRDLPGVYVSAVTPGDMTAGLLSPEPHVNRLDTVETGALVYLVGFDLSEFDLHFAVGTDHPRLEWSPRPPESAYDPRLPGPDGVASPAPLVMNGLVSPTDLERTVATFAGGFKRAHGAFRYGPLALVNHGSHYGFIQEGTILSKLEPGLATLVVMSDGRVEMKSWTRSDDTSLASIRYARQNGVPLLEYDPAAGRGLPGTQVNLWGPGNWSGSAAEVLRTLRAGACLEEAGSRRFLLYGYFSAATPSAMARVFQAYQCRYAMQLDINALEHTYLALYVHRDRARLVEHLVQGMEQCDSRTREGLAPRFLAAPDDRDFFYLTRRDRPRSGEVR